jgi:hypothetical protein
VRYRQRRGEDQALIIDGANNHDWAKMTPIMQATLESCGRFLVSVSTLPPNDAAAEAWAACSVWGCLSTAWRC